MQSSVTPLLARQPAQKPSFGGILEELAIEHREAAVLLTQALKTTDPNERLELWARLRKELLSHERAEAKVLYSALKPSSALRNVVQRHEETAEELESAIATVDCISPGSDAWVEQFTILRRLVEEHIQTEENELFPRALLAIGETQALVLEDEYRHVRRAERQMIL